MTTSALYALYRLCYAEYDRSRNATWLPGRTPTGTIQAVIQEFAEEDARNGRPCRTADEFAEAVEHGLDALLALGLAA